MHRELLVSQNVDESPQGPLFPSQRAFLVQFVRGEPDGEARGRVEHVISGRSLPFESATDLWTFMSAVLNESSDSDRRARDPSGAKRGADGDG